MANSSDLEEVGDAFGLIIAEIAIVLAWFLVPAALDNVGLNAICARVLSIENGVWAFMIAQKNFFIAIAGLPVWRLLVSLLKLCWNARKPIVTES